MGDIWSIKEQYKQQMGNLWRFRGDRACVQGGKDPSEAVEDTIEYATISTTGNTTDFGNLSAGRIYARSTANSTRGLIMGADTSPFGNVIEFVTVPSLGNTADFGDLTVTSSSGGYAFSNQIRAVHGHGASTNVIDYVTIAHTGNAIDFGDSTIAAQNAAGAGASPTRGIRGGGRDPAFKNTLEYVTIDTLGNATDFGDLTAARDGCI